MNVPATPPECTRKDECRLRFGAATSTCMGWTPIYDGHGKLINQDPNRRTANVYCGTCKGSWVEVTKDGIKNWATPD